jgi:prepilin-type N-terminal cleavage/methylation domain-containing protein
MNKHTSTPLFVAERFSALVKGLWLICKPALKRSSTTSGLTLVEMLVAIAVMSVVMSAAYVTIHQSMKLHQSAMTDSNRVLARCSLAEALAADFRRSQQAQMIEPGKCAVIRADGAEVVYTVQAKAVLRSEHALSQSARTYEVGRAHLWLGDEPGASLRMKFSDQELVIAR